MKPAHSVSTIPEILHKRNKTTDEEYQMREREVKLREEEYLEHVTVPQRLFGAGSSIGV